MKYYKTKEFETLKSEWYSKLKESEFVDIENGADNEVIFKETFSPSEEKLEQIDKRDEFLVNDQNFRSDFERYVFKLYTDGLTYRKIEQHLSMQSVYPKMTHVGIYKLIKRLFRR